MSISAYPEQEQRCFGIQKCHYSNGLLYSFPSVAANLPYLPESSSVSRRGTAYFVPPAHIRGVAPAFRQGHALWQMFQPATGSFYVVCDASSGSPVPFVGRFLVDSFFRCFLQDSGSGSHRILRSACMPLQSVTVSF